MLMYLTAGHLVPGAELRVLYRLCIYQSLSTHNEIQQVLLLLLGFYPKV